MKVVLDFNPNFLSYFKYFFYFEKPNITKNLLCKFFVLTYNLNFEPVPKTLNNNG
jgi:hypothetical protein